MSNIILIISLLILVASVGINFRIPKRKFINQNLANNYIAAEAVASLISAYIFVILIDFNNRILEFILGLILVFVFASTFGNIYLKLFGSGKQEEYDVIRTIIIGIILFVIGLFLD